MTRQLWSWATIATVVLLASGCANSLKVTYISDPPGAVVYSNNKNFGYAPVTLEYQISEEDRQRGYVNLSGTQVRWASGASASVSTVRANLSVGYDQQFTFNRPESYPGRENDVHFALELQRLAIMQRQADAQESAAFWQMYNSIQQQQQAQQQRILRCNSTSLGNTINTTCY